MFLQNNDWGNKIALKILGERSFRQISTEESDSKQLKKKKLNTHFADVCIGKVE